MLDFMRDPIWQFWGALLAFLSLAVAAYTYIRQRRRKELGYRVLATPPLVQASALYGGRMQLLWDGKSLPDVTLVVVRLMNTGNQEIVAADYERPVALLFPGAAQVLAAEVNEANPTTLRPVLTVDERRVTLEPCLLNGGDALTVAVLVKSFTGDLVLDGRIAGVKDIHGLQADHTVLVRVLVALVAIALLAVFASMLFSPVQQIAPGQAQSTTATALTASPTPWLLFALAGWIALAFLFLLDALDRLRKQQSSA